MLPPCSSPAVCTQAKHWRRSCLLTPHPPEPAGFVKGVGKGIIGAVAQPVSGGLDLMSSTFEGFGAVQDNLMGRQRSNARRLRLPRAIGGDCKLQPFLRADGEKQVGLSGFCFSCICKAEHFLWGTLLLMTFQWRRLLFESDAEW